MHLGRADEAIAAWEGACKNAPKDPSLKAALGFGYLKLGRVAEAGVTCAEAVELGLRDVETLFAFGRLFERLTRFEDAVKAYRRIGEVNPDHAEALKRLVASLMELRRWSDAIEPFQQAILTAPNDAELRYGLGVCYANLGQKPAAKAQYDALRKLDPKKAEELRRIVES
jgi:Flp pilus assembly protein TadD